MTYRRHCVRGALAACATVLLVAASSVAAAAVPAAAGTGLKKVHDPGRVTGTIHGHCSYRDHGQLPDPRCTPGSIDPHVTQADIRSTICKKGWTSTVRPPESQTERFKYDVAYPAYRTPQAERTELDHLLPLELGGSNDATNLWPEYPPTPNPKDKVEDALNAAVCEGRVSLTAAQDAIAADWLTAEKKLGLGGGGGGGGRGAPPALLTTPGTATTTSMCTPTSRTGQSPPPLATGHRIATGPTPAAMPTCTCTPQAATR